jgi:hypothetical protein
VTGDGSQQHGPGSPLWGSEPAADVVEQGGRRFPSLHWRPPRGAAILVAVGLVAGLALGYAAGDRQASKGVSPPRPAPGAASPVPSLVAGSPALTQTFGTCAAQVGRELQLGVQVTNRSTADITLKLVHPVLPLGGLKWVSQQWAPCSALATGQDPAILTPGASTWFSVTFEVLLRCPGPLPVQFMIDYELNGQPAVTTLPGFPNLSQVPYAGCPEG